MSSATGQIKKPSSEVASRPSKSQPVKSRLHDHLLRTARFIKWLDCLTLIFAWIAIGLAAWLVVATIDHWLLPLTRPLRWIVWCVAVIFTVWCFVRYLMPLVLGRINPTYAARRIEELVPEFKNGLISWLELEQIPSNGVPRGIMASLAYRASRFIGGQDPSATVDTGPLIKLIGLVLLLTTSLALYTMFSPKSALVTAQRVLMPWKSISAPTRVQLLSITPGDATVTQGNQLQVSVELRGLRSDETVYVKLTTLDGQIVDRRIALNTITEGMSYEGAVATTPSGIEHAFRYWVEAGDALAGPYQIKLNPRPSVDLQRIEVTYPPYTRLPKRTFSGRDVEAVEGSVATIFARGNQPMHRGRLEVAPETGAEGQLVRAKAFIEMQVEDRALQADWLLRLNDEGDNPTRWEFRIRGYNRDGEANRQPVSRRLAVLADMPPEIRLLGPESRILQAHAGGILNLEVRANDPDFGLAEVILETKINSVPAASYSLLGTPDVTGRQVLLHRLDMRALAVSPGDNIQVRATARDNRRDPVTKRRSPNTTTSQPLLIEIVDLDELNEPKPNAQSDPDAASDQSEANDDGAAQGATPGAESQDPGAPIDNRNASTQTDQSGANSGDQRGDPSNSSESDSNQQSGQPDQESHGGGLASADKEGAEGAEESQQSGSGNQSSSSQGAGSSQQESASSGSGNSTGSEQDQAAKSGSSQAAGSSKSSGKAGQDDQRNGGGSAGTQSDPGDAGSANGKTRPGSDAEAFEKVKEFMESSRQSPPDSEREQAAEQESGSQESGSQQSSGQESGGQESGGQESGGQESGGQESGGQQSGGQQSGSQESGSQESGGQESGGQESGSQQSGGQQSGGQQSGGQESGGQESGGQQSGGQESGGQESGGQESGGQESGGQESGSQQSGGQASGGQESGSQESGSQESGSQQSGGQQSGGQESGGQESGGQQLGSQESGSQESGGQESGGQESGGQESGGQESGGQQSGSQESGSEESGSEESGSEESGSEESGGSTGQAAGAEPPQSSAETDTNNSDSSQSQEGSTSSAQPAPSAEGEQSGAPQTGQQQSSPSSSSGSPSSSSGASQSLGGNSNGSQSGEAGDGGDVRQADAANQEFSERTTQMVLDYLNRQKDQPDAKLLEELDWTQSDLRQFTDRWNRARQLAQSGDPTSAQQWEELLQELGGRMATGRSVRSSQIDDNFQEMLDAGSQIRAPANLRKQYEAFLEALENQ